MIIIKDSVPLHGKGLACPEEFLRCEAVGLLDADPARCAEHEVVVFHISEDTTPHMPKWQRLAKAIRATRPDVTIWNEPRCDLADKLAVDDFIQANGGIPGVEMPQSWRLKRLEDCAEVTTFPCVVRKPRCSGGAGMLLAESPEALRTAAASLGYWPLQATEFIGASPATHVAVRLHIIGHSLADYWAIPAANWNIHAHDADWSLAVACDDRFRDWIAAFDVRNLIDRVRRIFGPGWYALDTVWTWDRLWFCEIGLKAADPVRAKLFRDHGVRWKVPKCADTPGLIESLIAIEITGRPTGDMAA